VGAGPVPLGGTALSPKGGEGSSYLHSFADVAKRGDRLIHRDEISLSTVS
jgi:hypothetical protein